jgi:uncharacterized protein YecE (DUF72 family)
MEFGKVDASVLATIDFTLPEDGYFTRHLLPGKRADDPKVYIGGAKWGRTEWEGIIYPPGTKEKEFLGQYVNHFNCIELNATHYKIYPESTIEKWAAAAKGKAFKFCPKVTQSISHYSDLGSVRAKELTDQFLQGVTAFGESLGPDLQTADRSGKNRSA